MRLGPVQRAHSRETGKTMAIAMQWGKYFGSDRSGVLWEYLEMHSTQSGGGGEGREHWKRFPENMKTQLQ